jgi:hypothetical protein
MLRAIAFPLRTRHAVAAMWGRAFMVLALLLAGAPPPPLFGKAARGGSRGFIAGADAQIAQSGNAFAVKCVRRREQHLRSPSRCLGARIRTRCLGLTAPHASL